MKIASVSAIPMSAPVPKEKRHRTDLGGSIGCSPPCLKPWLSSSLRRWCAGIGAGSVCTGVASRVVVSAGLRSRPTSAI